MCVVPVEFVCAPLCVTVDPRLGARSSPGCSPSSFLLSLQLSFCYSPSLTSFFPLRRPFLLLPSHLRPPLLPSAPLPCKQSPQNTFLNMPFPTRESSFDRGRKSQLPPSPGPPDWVAVGNDFSPMPTPTKHSPPSHSRKGSIASKIYRALSLNRRDAGPSPRVTVSDISSPIPTPSTPVQWPGARPIDRTPTPLDPSAAGMSPAVDRTNSDS